MRPHAASPTWPSTAAAACPSLHPSPPHGSSQLPSLHVQRSCAAASAPVAALGTPCVLAGLQKGTPATQPQVREQTAAVASCSHAAAHRAQRAAASPKSHSAVRALTEEQQEVVRRVMAWQDYVLVMGLPGAGKTTTIAAMVQVRAPLQPACMVVLWAWPV
jgi:phosphate starvation-inducible protein PhoH